MFVYLIRHGEAKNETEDPERGLTEKGTSDVASVAGLLKRMGLKVSTIYHSEKKRAAQTASLIAGTLIAGTLNHLDAPEEAEGLKPNDDPSVWFERLKHADKDTTIGIMLVGHLPFLERLAYMLLGVDSVKEVINFRTGAVLCLRRTGQSFSIEWMVTPEKV